MLGTDLVVIKFGKDVSVLYGRCLHRGALLADGFIRGNNLICGLHNWDYRNGYRSERVMPQMSASTNFYQQLETTSYMLIYWMSLILKKQKFLLGSTNKSIWASMTIRIRKTQNHTPGTFIP